MRPRLPPLNNLKAFDAAARHESFTRAAEELCVTEGAVSQQVKALEATLGIKLFNRERQRLIITEAGRDYLTIVRDALDRIALGTERLLQRLRERPVFVAIGAADLGDPAQVIFRLSCLHVYFWFAFALTAILQ
jgi:DNA-binding transcriptional LysR family regulator